MNDRAKPTALVTGSAVRLGRAIALGLAELGYPVGIHYRTSGDQADETAARARQAGVEASTFEADLADADLAAGLVDRVAGRLGPVGILVNSASIFDRVGFEQTGLDLWQRHLAVNLTAPFLLSQAFARQAPATGGAVLNLLDWRALRPTAASFAYTIAKAGLAAMTRSLARTLAPGIRVNGLALGAILPPPGEDDFSNGVLEPVPAGRPGSETEVARAAIFLLTGADYVTGEIVHLDGGRHLV